MATLGPKGTYAQQALHKKFGKGNVEEKLLGSSGEVFRAVDSGEADYGLVPVQTSRKKWIVETFDYLWKWRDTLNICGEIELEISHSLLAAEGARLESIERVYGHERALHQSREWLAEYLKKAKRYDVDSSGVAIERVLSGEGCFAAVAGNFAMELYNEESCKPKKLVSLADNIEHAAVKTTRFLIISKQKAPSTDEEKKTTVLVRLPHKPNALMNTLLLIKEKKVNMQSLVSRSPVLDPWTFLFFIDFNGDQEEGELKELLDEFKNNDMHFGCLGTYPMHSPSKTSSSMPADPLPLDELRKLQTSVDQKILEQLNGRIRLVEEIGRIKKEGSIYRPEREAELLRALIKENKKDKGSLSKNCIEAIFREVISRSYFYQCQIQGKKPLRVVTLGSKGTYEQEALRRKFGTGVEADWLNSIDEVFCEVDNKDADYGLVPLTNILEGMEGQTLDCFWSGNYKNVQVCGEIELPIHHCLLAAEEPKETEDKKTWLENVKYVYGHFKALRQSSQWLCANLGQAQWCEVDSSMEAIGEVLKKRAKDKSKDESELRSVAVVGDLAQELLELTEQELLKLTEQELRESTGLNYLENNIGDFANNKTRFLIIGRHPVDPCSDGKNQTTILVQLKKDKPGLLWDTLMEIQNANTMADELKKLRNPNNMADVKEMLKKFRDTNNNNNMADVLEEMLDKLCKKDDDNEAHSLPNILEKLRKNFNIDMKHIESCPLPDKPKEGSLQACEGGYLFFIDLDHHQDDDGPLGHVLEKIEGGAHKYKCLGSYPKHLE